MFDVAAAVSVLQELSCELTAAARAGELTPARLNPASPTEPDATTAAGRPGQEPGVESLLDLLAIETRVMEQLEMLQLVHLDALNEQGGAYQERTASGWGGVMPQESVSAEVSTRCGWSQQATENRLALAHTVHRRLPALGAALAAGHLTVKTARGLDAETSHLSPEAARAVIDAVLAYNEGHTTGQLRHKARRVITARATFDPEIEVACQAKAAHLAATRRNVELLGHLDGYVSLTATLTTVEAALASAAISDAAHALQEHDEALGMTPRSLNNARADAFCAFLQAAVEPAAQGASQGAGPARPPVLRHLELSILTSWTALMRVSRRRGNQTSEAGAPSAQPHDTDDPMELTPGYLSGIGEVNDHEAAEVALRLWNGSRVNIQWLIHDDAGQLKGASAKSTRYQPSPLLIAAIKARDVTCRFPGCHRPAATAEVDHVVPFPQGLTHESNLISLCRPHHRLKTHAGWQAQLNPADYSVTWTSPAGRRFTTHPRHYLEPGPAQARVRRQLAENQDLAGQIDGGLPDSLTG